MDSKWLASRVGASVMLAAIILAWSIPAERRKQLQVEKFLRCLEVSSEGFTENLRASAIVLHSDPRVFIGS